MPRRAVRDRCNHASIEIPDRNPDAVATNLELLGIDPASIKRTLVTGDESMAAWAETLVEGEDLYLYPPAPSQSRAFSAANKSSRTPRSRSDPSAFVMCRGGC